MVVLDLVTLALSDIGVLGVGQSIPAAQSSQALTVLSGIIDTMNAQRSLCYYLGRNQFTLSLGVNTYSIGPGGMFNLLQLPSRLHAAGIIPGSTIAGTTALEIPMRVLTEDEYINIRIKGQPSSWPTAVYYDNTDNQGMGNLIFNYTPTTTGNQVALYFPLSIPQVPTLATTLYIRPGYQEYVEGMLASRLAPKYGRDVPSTVREMLIEAAAALRGRNLYVPELTLTLGRRASYNVLTDTMC